MTTLRIQGAFTALVTPFQADSNHIDTAAFERLVQAQLDGGIDGLVPCGTTGETPTLSDDEQLDVIRRTVALAKGKVPIIAGVSSNCTNKTIKLAQHALEAGADAIMIVAPYYNKPTQEGLFAHVTTVASQVGGAPVVLYNIPGRSSVDISHDTVLRIAEATPNLVAIKDATGNVLRCQSIVQRLGDRITVMCGDDALTVAMMAVGAKGVISVTSNLVPDRVSKVCRLMLEGKYDEARKEHFALLALHEVLFIESSPGPVKAALASQGRIQLSLRLPLTAPTSKTQSAVKEVLQRVTSESAR